MAVHGNEEGLEGRKLANDSAEEEPDGPESLLEADGTGSSNGAKATTGGQNRDQDEPEEAASPLVSDDLVLDRALDDPDKDQFEHAAIAARVADLAGTTEPPVNIALFGPWGSGKSSVAGLIKDDLVRRDDSLAFIYYDAWRYGGHSLRRNFISNAASALKFDRSASRKFYEGLYESRRRAELHLGKLSRDLFRVGWRFVAVLVVFAALIPLVIAFFSEGNALDELKAQLPRYLAPAAVVALIVALAKSLLDTGRVDIDQKAPSADEEFSDRFRELIEAARSAPPRGSWPVRLRNWLADTPTRIWRYLTLAPAPEAPNGRPYERLIFFIDELDRSSKEDVVETLVAIRTFLDEEHCVFIVAADRSVLEEALEKEIPQETPVNEDSPYYSTAGAFLDKIFQHQVSLPPLRGRRLTRYARDLVAERDGGLWARLRDSGRLDNAIYALIPSNVRSPRRVKVLLNNFATSVRIAESRGVAWIERADEIAKLTVLQTEFPRLADDLALEPRLPRFLLSPDDPAAQTERAKELVERHDLSRAEADRDVYLPDDASVEDKFKAEQETKRLKQMRKRHQQQLRRYLERTAAVPDLRRDLLYLEAAGAAFGLDDPELGDRIEDDAPDDPIAVVTLIRKRSVDEQLASMRLLADMVQDLLGPERANVVTALLTLARPLEEELTTEVITEAANAIKTYLVEGELAQDQLTGALRIALSAQETDLVDELLANDLLWSDTGRLAEVGAMAPKLPAAAQSRLRQRIAAELPTDADVLVAPMRRLQEADAVALLRSEEIGVAVRDFIESGGTPDGAASEGV